MDVRVFPFSFPPIRGGAQGGVSPTPTPDPEPEYPYDLTGVSLVLEVKGTYTTWRNNYPDAYAPFKFSLAGIVVDDSSDVASVVLDLTTLDWTAGGNAVSADTIRGSISLDVNDPNVASSGGVYSSDYSIVGETIGVSGDVTFTAYDSNGEILQQDTITVVGF